MRKIKNYICCVLLLSAFMGYAQVNEYAGTPPQGYGNELREVVVVAHNGHSGGTFVTSLSVYLNANANQYPTSPTNYNSLPIGVDLSQTSLSNSFQTSGTSAATATSTKPPIPTGELLYQGKLSAADFVRLLRTLAMSYNVIKTVPYSYVGTADGVQRVGYLTTITDKYGTTTLYYFSEASGNGDQVRLTGPPQGGYEITEPKPIAGGYNAGGTTYVTLWDGTAQPQGTLLITQPNSGTVLAVMPFNSGVPLPTNLKNWYFDNDGDNWHSQTTRAAMSPGGKWKTATFGSDCDDNNHTKTNNCNITCKDCLEKDPCTDTSKPDALTKLANIAYAKKNVLQLQADALTKTSETSFLIKTDDKGVSTTTAISNGSGNTAAASIDATTQVLAHAHNDNAQLSIYPASSAGDIYTLFNGSSIHSNFKNNMSVGLTKAYALIIEDATAFKNFAESYIEKDCLAGSDFTPNTDLDDEFWKTHEILKKQGETPDEAHASAMAYFLSKNNIGVGLYSSNIASDGGTTFKRKNTVKEMLTPEIPAFGLIPAVPATFRFIKKDCL